MLASGAPVKPLGIDRVNRGWEVRIPTAERCKIAGFVEERRERGFSGGVSHVISILIIFVISSSFIVNGVCLFIVKELCQAESAGESMDIFTKFCIVDVF
ncbi:hypothetical protein ElyMa_002588700 [Elysia marginata]|uniref:G-protein coupled receptors family 1 profile domain-containing protein n=1 Tax=Elysia marginata TaxID=1093978 RepID=A0AAV4GZG6_9GAST|nr:hypothetical protein ElyMa_002588700 [Elysia marginata]